MTNSFQPPEFLTYDEVLEVDRALLTARDKFSARVALYALRALKLVAAQAEMPIASLSQSQIADWVSSDPSLQAGQGFDSGFKEFFAKLVIASLKPLKQISAESQTPIDALSISQVVAWFEKEAKLRLERGEDATFLGN